MTACFVMAVTQLNMTPRAAQGYDSILAQPVKRRSRGGFGVGARARRVVHILPRSRARRQRCASLKPRRRATRPVERYVTARMADRQPPHKNPIHLWSAQCRNLARSEGAVDEGDAGHEQFVRVDAGCIPFVEQEEIGSGIVT